MNKKDPTPPRTLQTLPQNTPAQPANEDSTSEEEETPDIRSDELFPLNIIPFSDDDTNDQDPDYIVSEDSTSNSSDEEEEEHSENTEEEEEEDPENNMADPNPPPPTVSGGQLSSVSHFTGNQGLDGLVYVEAIDRAMEQFG